MAAIGRDEPVSRSVEMKDTMVLGRRTRNAVIALGARDRLSIEDDGTLQRHSDQDAG
jgi:hypothetical protein